MKTDVYTAFHRFGLGARPDDPAAIAGDPRGAVLAEIDPLLALIDDPELPDTREGLRRIIALQRVRREQRASEADAETMATGEDEAEMPAATSGPNGSQRNPLVAEVAAQFRIAGTMQVGFAERWTMFWANHFAIETDANQLVRWTAGPYEREAIRPFVFGRFEDLLVTATKHPAMLRYLNNASSIGPNSRGGTRRSRGLNENHARELLELHTLGVEGGYTQDDVAALANVLTGWTFVQDPEADGFGRFRFAAQTHEPGSKSLLGMQLGEDGLAEGEAVLRLLATHEATARHIATKLVRHFVADAPPPVMVERLTAAFLETEGDLGSVAKALVSLDDAWAAPPTKLRLPAEYLRAAVRGLAIRPRPNLIVRSLTLLGQAPFNPPSPAGFRDDVATWLAPDAMTVRLDVAELLASEADASADARAVAEAMLGDALSAATRETIARAEGPVQGLAIMLMSPEFQRR